MKQPKTQNAFLLELLDEAYDLPAWHGPNLRNSLRGVTARQAAWRPRPGRHNIWEVAVHAAYWKYAVRRRLLGGKRGSFALKGSNWFERPDSATEEEWRADLALLEEEHRKLRETVAGLPAAAKTRLIYGIAFHDVYHAGQIQVLKRLCPIAP